MPALPAPEAMVMTATTADTRQNRPDPRLRLILFGGGHGADSRDTERLFGEWAGPDGSVLVIAGTDQHPADVQRDIDRLAGHLRDAGVRRVTVWDASVIGAPGFAADLSAFDGGCFAASRPHQVVPLLRSSGLDAALIEAARAGCVIHAEGQLLPVLGPSIRYTAIRDYDIGDHGIEDDRGLGLTTDGDGHPTVYMGSYRALPSSNRRHPQRVANESGARVCVIPPMGVVAIHGGEVRATGRRAFAWYQPKPRRPAG